MRGDVWKPASTVVGVLLVLLPQLPVHRTVEVRPDRAILVPRALEVVTESASAAHPGNFRTVPLSPADCGDIGAGCGELGCELNLVGAVVCSAGRANAYGAVSSLVSGTALAGCLPPSPEAWIIDTPRSPIMPIKLQVRMAYSLGTVYLVQIGLVSSLARTIKSGLSHLLIFAVRDGYDLGNLLILQCHEMLVKL